MASRTRREANPGGGVVGVVVPTFFTAAVASGSALALVLTGSVTIGGLGAPVTGAAGRGSIAALPRVQAPAGVPAPSSPRERATPQPMATSVPDDDTTGVPVTFRPPSARTPVVRPTVPGPHPAPEPDDVPAPAPGPVPDPAPTPAPTAGPTPDPPSTPRPSPTGGTGAGQDGHQDPDDHDGDDDDDHDHDHDDDGDHDGGPAGGRPKGCDVDWRPGPRRDLTHCPLPVRDRRHQDGGPQRDGDGRGPRRDDPKSGGAPNAGGADRDGIGRRG